MTQPSYHKEINIMRCASVKINRKNHFQIMQKDRIFMNPELDFLITLTQKTIFQKFPTKFLQSAYGIVQLSFHRITSFNTRAFRHINFLRIIKQALSQAQLLYRFT